jgi:hypothetical protein
MQGGRLMNDEIDRISKLEEKIQRIYNIAWVLGSLAVIFGISGAFGYKVLH